LLRCWRSACAEVFQDVLVLFQHHSQRDPRWALAPFAYLHIALIRMVKMARFCDCEESVICKSLALITKREQLTLTLEIPFDTCLHHTNRPLATCLLPLASCLLTSPLGFYAGTRINFWTTFPKLNSPISFPNEYISRFYFGPI